MSEEFKKDLEAVLTKHNFVLYEDDGIWALRDAYYDRLTICFYPSDCKAEYLPNKGAYIRAIV